MKGEGGREQVAAGPQIRGFSRSRGLRGQRGGGGGGGGVAVARGRHPPETAAHSGEMHPYCDQSARLNCLPLYSARVHVQ